MSDKTNLNLFIVPDGVFVEVSKCPKCDGEWKYYNGALGYESYKCKQCRFDIQDIKIKKGE